MQSPLVIRREISIRWTLRQAERALQSRNGPFLWYFRSFQVTRLFCTTESCPVNSSTNRPAPLPLPPLPPPPSTCCHALVLPVPSLSHLPVFRRDQKVVEAEVRRLSGQLEAVDCEVVEAEEAVVRSSERMRQANAEFSSLMAAMSVAFREYDQAVSIELCFHHAPFWKEGGR